MDGGHGERENLLPCSVAVPINSPEQVLERYIVLILISASFVMSPSEKTQTEECLRLLQTKNKGKEHDLVSNNYPHELYNYTFVF